LNCFAGEFPYLMTEDLQSEHLHLQSLEKEHPIECIYLHLDC
jgi:hypothetical protein